MSKARSTALRNKARGRAFQTKLAQMAGGINIGTLGGEDVMHDEFSYEAKTYNINATSYKGKNWAGEDLMLPYDAGLASNKMVIIRLTSFNFSPLYMIRWYWWKELLESRVSLEELRICQKDCRKERFIGNTYMRQAESNCPDAKVPIVVVHTTGKRHENDIVVVKGFYWESVIEFHVPKYVDK
jgi:hypothetical protein